MTISNDVKPVPESGVQVAAPKKKGFAALSPEQRAAISSLGGKAAHAAGTGHKFTTEEAREAGKKGGTAPHKRRGRGPTKTEKA